MTVSANLGFPRIGAHRELKFALESYWKGATSKSDLLATAAQLRARHWQLQQTAGIEVIPSNDFTLYDHVLDTALAFGAVPERFADLRGGDPLDLYFACARGSDAAPAMEMTKWFDTNYHYIVPEFHAGQTFRLASTKAVDEFNEAKALGIHTRPVLIGPVTFLSLGKAKEPDLDPLSLLDALLPIYAEILAQLRDAGADWVQFDEPVLALDLNAGQKAAFEAAYAALSLTGVKILIATYFEKLGSNLDVVLEL